MVTVLTIAAVNRWLGSDIAAMVTLSANKAGMSCSNPVACEVALFVSSRDLKKKQKTARCRSGVIRSSGHHFRKVFFFYILYICVITDLHLYVVLWVIC